MKYSTHKKNAALLVVDAQESFKARGKDFWESGGPEDFEDNITALVNGFRRAGRPVFFILHTDDDPGFSTDSPYFRVLDCLAPQPAEPVIVKQVHNAFTGTPLLPLLLRDNITKVVICGIRTEQCCETTARVASDLGFEVDYVTRATRTFPLTHPVSGETLTVEQLQARTETVLHKRFARIATVETVLKDLQES